MTKYKNQLFCAKITTVAIFFIYLGGGGGTKILRNTYEGSCQMLTFDDKRGEGGRKPPKHAYLINGCSLSYNLKHTEKSVNNSFCNSSSNIMHVKISEF